MLLCTCSLSSKAFFFFLPLFYVSTTFNCFYNGNFRSWKANCDTQHTHTRHNIHINAVTVHSDAKLRKISGWAMEFHFFSVLSFSPPPSTKRQKKMNVKQRQRKLKQNTVQKVCLEGDLAMWTQRVQCVYHYYSSMLTSFLDNESDRWRRKKRNNKKTRIFSMKKKLFPALACYSSVFFVRSSTLKANYLM